MTIRFDFNTVRNSRYSLYVMQTLPEMKIATSKPTQLGVKTLKNKMDINSFKLVLSARAVAFSASFENCHKC